MRAGIDELKFKSREEEEREIESETYTAKVSSQEDAPSMEIDLRGKRVDEGLQLLERYLDSAFLAKLPWVRIIHGKGTGRLRANVRQALNESGHVASWEEGRDGEGGAGVTVAKLLID
jgi:DNA mismatch repair protein MutS2